MNFIEVTFRQNGLVVRDLKPITLELLLLACFVISTIAAIHFYFVNRQLGPMAVSIGALFWQSVNVLCLFGFSLPRYRTEFDADRHRVILSRRWFGLYTLRTILPFSAIHGILVHQENPTRNRRAAKRYSGIYYSVMLMIDGGYARITSFTCDTEAQAEEIVTLGKGLLHGENPAS